MDVFVLFAYKNEVNKNIASAFKLISHFGALILFSPTIQWILSEMFGKIAKMYIKVFQIE